MTSAFSDVISDLKRTNTDTKRWDLESKYSTGKFDRILKERQAGLSDYEAVIISSLRNGSSELMSIFVDPLLNSRTYVDWKKNPEMIGNFMRVISECDYDENYSRDHQYVIDNIINISKRLRIQSNIQPTIKEIILKSLHTSQLWHPILRASMSVSGEYTWKDGTENFFSTVYSLILVQIKKRPDPPNGSYFYNNIWMISTFSLSFIPKLLYDPLAADLANIFEFCKKEEFYSEDDCNDTGSKTLTHAMCLAIMQCLDWNKFSPSSLSTLIPHIKDLRNCGDDELGEAAERILIETKNTTLDEDTGEAIVSAYLKGGKDVLICKFPALYKTNPEAFDGKILAIMERMHTQDWILTTTMTLLWEVAKAEPKTFSEEMIRDVADTVQIPNTGPAALMVLAALAQTRPGDVIHYEHEVQCAIEDLPLGGDAGMGVLVPLSTLGEVHAKRYIDFLFTRFEQNTEQSKKVDLLNYIRRIGTNWPATLLDHEPMLRTLAKKKDEPVGQAAHLCLDVTNDEQ